MFKNYFGNLSSGIKYVSSVPANFSPQLISNQEGSYSFLFPGCKKMAINRKENFNTLRKILNAGFGCRITGDFFIVHFPEAYHD